MRGWISIAALVACTAAPLSAGDIAPLSSIVAEAELTRAIDRVLLAPRRFALRRGPNLRDLQAIAVCQARRVDDALEFSIVFEQLEGESTSFDYVLKGGEWTSLRCAVNPADKPDPLLEARADLTQSPPVVHQRDAKGQRAPVPLPWRGDELGELFVLFVLSPLADCGLEQGGTLRMAREMNLLGPAERATPFNRRLTVAEAEGRLVVELHEGQQFSARVRLGEGRYAGHIARVEFTDGLYADPISEATYNRMHHAMPLRMSPPPHYAATDALGILQAAQLVQQGRNGKAGTLAELGAAKLIDTELAAGRTRGWTVEVGVSEDGQRWVARAYLQRDQWVRCFAVNHTHALVVASELVSLDPDQPYPKGANPIERRTRW